jgi:hypothetical protein
LLLKITIKVLKITLAIEKNNKYENQQIIWKIKKCEEISGKIVNFIVFLVTSAILPSLMSHLYT